MKKIILILFVLFLATPVWGVETLKNELFIKTGTVEITNKVRGTEHYRQGWFYGVTQADFQDLKDLTTYVAQEHEQVEPWTVTDDAAYTSYKVRGVPVIIYIHSGLLIIAR